MIKASARAACILLAGLFFAGGGPSQAAPMTTSASATSDSESNSAEAVKSTKHRRHYARHHSSKTAQKSSDDKTDRKDISATDNAAPASKAMPPSVANANAQLAAADGTPAAAANTARANDNAQAVADNTGAAPGGDNQVVKSDQINEVDRALQEDNSPAQRTVVTAADAQPRPALVMAASGSESSTWDQTSLIGKIFIGFGALLTLASAARMFMA